MINEDSDGEVQPSRDFFLSYLGSYPWKDLGFFSSGNVFLLLVGVRLF